MMKTREIKMTVGEVVSLYSAIGTATVSCVKDIDEAFAYVRLVNALRGISVGYDERMKGAATMFDGKEHGEMLEKYKLWREKGDVALSAGYREAVTAYFKRRKESFDEYAAQEKAVEAAITVPSFSMEGFKQFVTGNNLPLALSAEMMSLLQVGEE